MRRKVLFFLLSITLTTAIFSWGATTWQLQTKLNTGGGYIKVRNLSPQTTSGSLVFTNFTTSADIPVAVGANEGYRISSLSRNGSSVILDNYSAHYSTTFNKSAGTVQSLVAGFAVKTFPVTATVSGPGAVSPSSASVGYNGSLNLNALPTFVSGMVTAVTVNGAPYPATYPVPGSMTISLSNITAATNVAVSFVTVTANAGPDRLVVKGAPVTLNGSSAGGVPPSWSQVSGPVPVDTSGCTTLTPSFTLSTSGSYTFKLNESVRGQVLASDTVQVTVTDSIIGYMRTSCNGCHNDPAGVSPSTAFRLWSSSRHKEGGTNCISCHSSAAMPTPVNTATVNRSTYVITSASAGPVGTNYCMTCHNASIATEFAAARHAAVITCSSCHVSQHKPTAVASSTFRVYTSGGYSGRIICLDCHGGVNTTHYFSRPSIADACAACHATASHNPVSTMEASLGSRHFNGYTSVTGPNYRAAYVTPTTPCTSCHLGAGPAPDAAQDASIAAQRADWGSSGHGDTRGAGWMAADFKKSAGCVQCHTTVGFIAFSSARAAGAWGESWDSSSAVLSCNACHTDTEAGKLRAAAPIRPYGSDPYLAPQASTSNLCMMCHCGTESGRGIKAKAAGEADFTSRPFSGSHSSAAAGILFRSVGYEFAFRSYSNSWHFKHDRLGQNRFKAYGYQSGSDGPCIACHMTSANSHTFSPLAKDENGAVVGISSTSCAGCHQGPAFLDAARLKSRETRYAASLHALQKVLESRGIYYANAAPYFFKSAASTDATNAFTAWGNPDTVGAAFNFCLLKHEPGAYAHNMLYAKRLIYDSIDYLDNGALDDSVLATINALPGLDSAQLANAVGYLAPSGVRP